MATSSITHNFFITDPATVERFVKAFEVSEEEAKHRPPVKPAGKVLTDPEEISEAILRIKAHLKAEGKI
ncbi:MAG: hypothetical protein IKN43_05620 [Selenomonadaceae bacterium]|nr:hypothetical protein [Selenomonadaceae bacterium]